MVVQGSIEVSVQIAGEDVPAGVLFFHSRRVERSTFQYSASYLSRPDAYALDPVLPLSGGSFQSKGATFSAFADAAPDRWGRILIERRERQRAREEGRASRAVLESDFVLGVNDLTRQGAIRFRSAGRSEFQAPPNDAVPTLVSLPDLLHAADQVTRDDDSALKVLLDAGSASLGGARPKTAVDDGSGLLIAKFPHASDEWDVMAWEKTALDLAELAGIVAPRRTMHRIGERHALLIRRFDRIGDERIGYMSARTMMESDDDRSDYTDLAETLELITTETTKDLNELWRRALFSVLINNTDDHLRNHGVIRRGAGWRLSPVFDVNPNPDSSKGRVTSILGEVQGVAQVDALVDVCEQFRLKPDAATTVAEQVRTAVRQWRTVATRNGITPRNCDRMAEAFALAG